MSDNKLNYKATMDRLLNDLRKACHSMIDQDYVSESPIKLLREALDYLDQKHLEKIESVKK